MHRDADGRLKPHGIERICYPNGRIKLLRQWEKGQKQGREILWNEQGERRVESHFLRDRLTARKIWWWGLPPQKQPASPSSLRLSKKPSEFPKPRLHRLHPRHPLAQARKSHKIHLPTTRPITAQATAPTTHPTTHQAATLPKSQQTAKLHLAPSQTQPTQKIRYMRFLRWYEGGERWSEAIYMDGKKEGLALWWHRNGRKQRAVSYSADKAHGLMQRWYANGQKEEEGHYKMGIREGIWQRWFPDGKRQRLRTFRAGALHGEIQGWHKNNRLAYRTFFHKGRRHKQHTHWTPQGQKRIEMFYHFGKPCGVESIWSPQGILLTQRSYPPCPSDPSKP